MQEKGRFVEKIFSPIENVFKVLSIGALLVGGIGFAAISGLTAYLSHEIQKRGGK